MLDRGATLATLIDALRWAASAFPERGYHYPAQGERLRFEEVAARSEAVARRLRSEGLARGQLVGLLLNTGPHFITCFLGIQRAGGVPVPLALAGGKDIGAYFERLGQVLRDGEIRWLVVDAAVRGLLAGGQPPPELRLLLGEELANGGAVSGPDPIAPAPEDLAFVQYTSGSTAAPKGVAISHANAIAGLRSITISGQFTSDDVFCSWLPHFHDMGLVGNLLMGLYNGCETHLFPPSSFIKAPADFLAYFAAKRATIYTGPNFSYAYLCEDLTPEQIAALDLSAFRLAFNGAEAIDPALLETFIDKLAPAGFRPEAMYPVYGLAEATLAATFPAVGERPSIDWVDRAALGSERLVRRVDHASPAARGVVALGYPVAGLDLRIVDEAGQALGEDLVGEVELRGAAVMRGYYRNPKLSAEAIHDGWLRTGDLGYRKDGRLHLVGRSKDVIKHAGESYYPEDIEAVVRGLDGVYRGGCVAFVGGPLGEERIVCVVETEIDDRAGLERLAEAIGRKVGRAVGLQRLDVLLVRKRAISRTTSGKLQRQAMRRRLEQRPDGLLLHELRL